MNILVTGCAGFIGSWVCQRLIETSEHKVIGVDNFDSYYPKDIKLANMKSFKDSKNFVFYESDITDENAMASLFCTNNIDIVIHLAAKAGVRNSAQNPLEYSKVNAYGTLNILNCMKKHNVKKIVFASSSSVYGKCNSEKFCEDMTDLTPLSVYSQTKKSAEEYIELYSRQYGINALCLRFFTVYGQRQRPDLAICKFTSQIINGEKLTMYGDGSTCRDYTHIEDILQGILSAVYYDKTPYEIINLGSQNPVKLADLILLLEEITGKKADIEICPIPQEDVHKTYADITKAKKLLGYRPKINFKSGLYDFVKSYKEQHG